MKNTFMRGFTLLEIMLVVAIMGIMVTFAIPMFQDYVIRVRVAEGFELSMPARVAVSEYYLAHQTFANEQTMGYTSTSSSDNVESIHIVDKGQVVITYTKVAGNGTLVLSPEVKAEQQIIWHCQDGTLDKKYLPRVCELH